MFPVRSPLIINLAPTGMVPTRTMSNKVPLSPAEIISDVLACADLGITMVHLHARDDAGNPSHNKDIYARLIAGIREKRADLVIGVSCSGRGGLSLEQRTEVLGLKGDLQPDMASLTLSSLNFSRDASINSPAEIIELVTRMRDNGIKPECEIFDLGMANMLQYLHTRKLIDGPVYANLLFGNLASAQARWLEIAAMVSNLPAQTVCSFAGLGTTQLPMAMLAIVGAAGVRIGLEDNLWRDHDRQHLANNPELVAHVTTLAKMTARELMTPAQLRQLLGLRPAF